MKMPNALTAPAARSRSEPGKPFPNMNLLPRELARPVVSSLGIMMILFLLVEAGSIGALQVRDNARNNAMAASSSQLVGLNRRLGEASAIREEANRMRSEIAVLEESPKLYLQLIGYFDKSAVLQTLIDYTPPGVELGNVQIRATSLVLQGKAYPNVALDYYQTLRNLAVFESVIIRFVSTPDPAKQGDFSIEIAVRRPVK